MLSDLDVVRAFVRLVLREGLDPRDVVVSKQPVRLDVDSSGMGQPVLVQLGDKAWLTRSQVEVDRVLRLGGKIVSSKLRR